MRNGGRLNFMRPLRYAVCLRPLAPTYRRSHGTRRRSGREGQAGQRQDQRRRRRRAREHRSANQGKGPEGRRQGAVGDGEVGVEAAEGPDGVAPKRKAKNEKRKTAEISAAVFRFS